jgi:DNA-binding Xre family transcriptional regulator
MTKLKKILKEKDITQRELYGLIKEKCNIPIGEDRISKIVHGKLTNYSMHTLLKICLALDVSPNEIVEKDNFIKEECK